MKRFLLEPRRLTGVSVTSLVLGVLMSLLFSNTFDIAPFELHMYSFYFELNPSEIISALIMLIPVCVITALLSDVFSRDYKIVSTYCFCRFESTQKWYRIKFCSLLLYSLFSALLYSTANFFTTACVSNESVQMLKEMLPFGCLAFVLQLFFIFTLTSVINVLSEKMSSKWAFLLQISVLFSSLAVLKIKPAAKLLKFNPILNYMLPCHGDISARLKSTEGLMIVKDMTVTFSVLYFAVITLIVFFIGAAALKKSDPGLREE